MNCPVTFFCLLRLISCFRYNAVILQGGVPKWSKGEVCKTFIRRFESARRLHLPLETLESPGC